jgi:hypothetical protein
MEKFLEYLQSPYLLIGLGMTAFFILGTLFGLALKPRPPRPIIQGPPEPPLSSEAVRLKMLDKIYNSMVDGGEDVEERQRILTTATEQVQKLCDRAGSESVVAKI